MHHSKVWKKEAYGTKADMWSLSVIFEVIDENSSGYYRDFPDSYGRDELNGVLPNINEGDKRDRWSSQEVADFLEDPYPYY